MTVILKKSVFIHIPKTGGTWIAKALQNAGLVNFNPCLINNRIIGVKHFDINKLKSTFPNKTNDKVFFTFIRNPVTWYQSIWTNPFSRRRSAKKRYVPRMSDMPLERKPVLHRDMYIFKGKSELKDFNKWANRIVNQYPGWLTRFYKHFIGENYEKISLIGKTENLAEDTIRILHELDEEFDDNKIINTKPVNQSNKNLDRSWDRRILRKIIDNESEFMERFGYSTSLKDYLELCN